MFKEKIYFEDGSLRDVMANHWSIEEWKEWAKMVNNQYNLGFYNGQTKTISDNINFQVVERYWDSENDLINTATIYLGQVTIKCYFFNDIEFENDIDPKEFKSVEDHLKFIDYLLDVSNINGKRVTITEENSPDRALLEVHGKEVIYLV